MNRPGLSLLVWHLTLTGLYFAGVSSSNNKIRMKQVHGLMNKDVTITCKYAESSLKPTLEPKMNTINFRKELPQLHTVNWQYYKQSEGQKNGKILLLGNRFLSSSTSSLFTAQLQIKKLQVTDAGFYFCVSAFPIKGAVTIEPDVTQLFLKARPIYQILEVPQLEAKKSTTLSLRVIGFYPKQITVDWLKDGTQLREGVQLSVDTNRDGTFNATSTVPFEPQIKDHGKTITCQITHQSVKILKSQKLEVSYGPVHLRVEPGNNTVKITGDLLELTCMVNSNPKAEMTWLLNGKALLTMKTNRLSIRVENISSSDQGTYVCSAKNKLGTRQATVVVTVITSLYLSFVPKTSRDFHRIVESYSTEGGHSAHRVCAGSLKELLIRSTPPALSP